MPCFFSFLDERLGYKRSRSHATTCQMSSEVTFFPLRKPERTVVTERPGVVQSRGLHEETASSNERRCHRPVQVSLGQLSGHNAGHITAKSSSPHLAKVVGWYAPPIHQHKEYTEEEQCVSLCPFFEILAEGILQCIHLFFSLPLSLSCSVSVSLSLSLSLSPSLSVYI